MNITSNKLPFVAISIISIFITCFLVSRYSNFWITDPDSANSPLVWRGFLEKGFDIFRDWKPTVDNWYFTVYPINFFFFYIFDDSGLAPIILSNVFFIAFVNIGISYIIFRNAGIVPALLAMLVLCIPPSQQYLYGYLSHPFSHNSTNAYGILAISVFLSNLKHNNYLKTSIIVFISLISSLSDPWFISSFLLPLILTELFFVIKEKKTKKPFIAYVLVFIVVYSNIIQHKLNLPTIHYRIVTNQIVDNTNNAILILSDLMPIFSFEKNISAYFIFITWLAVMIISVWLLYNKDNEVRAVAIISFLSILGIVSSSIIGTEIPTPRFYINIFPMLIILSVLAISLNGKFNKLILIPIILTFITSIIMNSDRLKKIPTGKNKVNSYINFLKKHNLSYGYGSFWALNMSANWLSNGDIHITPIFYNNNTGEIDFLSVRVQTMKSWHTSEFIKNAPDRQFIAITEGDTDNTCRDIKLCIDSARKNLGEPDEMIRYDDNTIFLIYKKIDTGGI